MMKNKIKLFLIFNIIIGKLQNCFTLKLISRYISIFFLTGGRHWSIKYDVIYITPPQIRTNDFLFLM